MTKLDLKKTTEVKGGKQGPSDRRCDRLYRRGMNGSVSAIDRFLRIC
ncbi:hypothetical protein [Polaribacter sp. 11A2H]|nr:hypothetical protein [Polaribacter sp. 11A2H]